MRILELITEKPPVKSGFATTARVLKDGLEARGHTVDVLSLADTKFWKLYAFRPNLMFLKCLKPWKYDVINVHGNSPFFSELLVLKLAPFRNKLVYTFHCDANSKYSAINKLYNSLHRLLLKIPVKVITTTPDYKAYSGVPSKSVAIPFGVDKISLKKKPAGFNVLFVGQMRLYKGVDVLLRAWKEIQGDGHLHLVGDGIDKATWMGLAKELNLKNLTWHGKVDDKKLSELYNKSHVIVLPSVNTGEAFGIVLLEGMSHGCFPVSSDLIGLRYVASHFSSTFPAGSHIGLARLLTKIRKEKQWATKRGNIGEFLKEHTWAKFIDRYEAVYASVAKSIK
ncbi:MAG: glycosyltransferase family 4 protein [archaeon]